MWIKTDYLFFVINSSYQFLISNFRLVLNLVYILLGISPVSDCGFPTFRNPLSDGGFRNVGKSQSDAGEIPKRIHTSSYQVTFLEFIPF